MLCCPFRSPERFFCMHFAFAGELCVDLLPYGELHLWEDWNRRTEKRLHEIKRLQYLKVVFFRLLTLIMWEWGDSKRRYWKKKGGGEQTDLFLSLKACLPQSPGCAPHPRSPLLLSTLTHTRSVQSNPLNWKWSRACQCSTYPNKMVVL